MKLHIKLHREVDADLTAMAKEAGVSCADMAEIAVYSVIAGWLQAKAEKEKGISLAVSPVVDPGELDPAAS